VNGFAAGHDRLSDNFDGNVRRPSERVGDFVGMSLNQFQGLRPVEMLASSDELNLKIA
jgi:hypothetical protein